MRARTGSVYKVLHDFEQNTAMAYHYDVDEVNAADVKLSDCYWMPCAELHALIDRGGDPAPCCIP